MSQFVALLLQVRIVVWLRNVAMKCFETEALYLVLFAPYSLIAGPLSSNLPLSDERIDRGHFGVELMVGKDMSVNGGWVVIVERLGKMAIGEPFTIIFGEILCMKPLAGCVALAAVIAGPPFAAIFEINRTKIRGVFFKDRVRAMFAINGDKVFIITIAVIIVIAEGRAILKATVTPLF
ncbi:MAG: hypothetical protein C0494_06775 [Sphingobium sp.]|nr:hypothetical protein [Sphingobium sp.]